MYNNIKIVPLKSIVFHHFENVSHLLLLSETYHKSHPFDLSILILFFTFFFQYTIKINYLYIQVDIYWRGKVALGSI